MENIFEQELNARASSGEEHVSFEGDATYLAVPKANVLKFDHDMVTDEVVVAKDEEVSKAIDELAASMAPELDAAAANQIMQTAVAPTLPEPVSEKLTTVPLIGRAETGKLYSYSITDPAGLTDGMVMGEQYFDQQKIQDAVVPDTSASEVLQRSMTTLKEFVENPAVLANLEAQGFTFDFKAIQATMDAVGFKSTTPLIVPLSEVAVGCACDTCLEENAGGLLIEEKDNVPCDVDTDTLAMLADLSERLTKLEQRIAEYNVRSSHKI